MAEAVKIRWFYLFSVIYIALNAVLIYFEMFYLFLLPVAIALLMLSFLSLDKLVLFIVLLTPLSIDLSESDIGIAISIPTEPLIIAAMLMFIFKVLAERNFDARIWKHPVTLIISFYILWGLITSVTSEIPAVSFKNMASKCWFIIPFYFMGVHIFKDKKNISRFPWMYVLGLIIVVVYTTYNHSLRAFEKDPAHWVMTPFYYDHTQYGAMLAFFTPFVVGYAFFNRHDLFVKILVFLAAGVILLGLFLSNSRAAWLSVVISMVFLVIFIFRIRWYFIVAGIGVVATFLWMNWTDIIMKLEKNKQDSSENFTEHIQSMSNIQTDASNLERLLRWNCALRMYRERPVFGWGPGTYMFVYAPFQKSYELTIISTNFGDGGNAHSEYLGPLSEQGFMGLINVLLIIIITYYTGSRIIYNNHVPRRMRELAIMIVLSLITYWSHSFLNNFLNTDKAAVPYWAFIAILVAIDMYHSGTKERDTKKLTETTEDVKTS